MTVQRSSDESSNGVPRTIGDAGKALEQAEAVVSAFSDQLSGIGVGMRPDNGDHKTTSPHLILDVRDPAMKDSVFRAAAGSSLPVYVETASVSNLGGPKRHCGSGRPATVVGEHISLSVRLSRLLSGLRFILVP